MGTVPGVATAAGDAKRWYKGMLHCHSYWSDGRAFPEQSVQAYCRRGYHFYCLSDHNRLGKDGAYWRNVCEDEGPWPKNVHRPIFERYRKDFPDADIREQDGKTQVRIKTFDEIKAKFDRPGRFLVLPGMEVTRITTHPHWADRTQVHMNYVNLNKGLASALAGSRSATVARTFRCRVMFPRTTFHAIGSGMSCWRTVAASGRRFCLASVRTMRTSIPIRERPKSVIRLRTPMSRYGQTR